MGKLSIEWGKCLVSTLTQLCIKDATFLIDFDNRRARIVCNDSTRRVAIEGALLDQRHVPWILLWESILVPDRNMWIDEGIGRGDVDQTIWVVSLADPV